MALGRKTGGRQKGTRNKATIDRELRAQRGIIAALDEGLMPLDVMLARMRDEPLPSGHKVTDDQFAAAVAAAPYLHPRLAATTLRGDRNAPLPIEHSAVVDNRPPIEEFLREFQCSHVDRSPDTAGSH